MGTTNILDLNNRVSELADGVTSVEEALDAVATDAVKNADYVGENFLKVLQIGHLVNVSGRFQVTTQKPAGQSYYLFKNLPVPAGDVISVNDISNAAFLITAGYLTSNNVVQPGYYNVQCTYAEKIN